MKYKKEQTVYHTNILYCDGYISSYTIGEYKVIGVVNPDAINPVYALRDKDEDAPIFRELEDNLFGSKKEVYEYLLEEYETDKIKLTNWYNIKEKFMNDDINDLKYLIKKG